MWENSWSLFHVLTFCVWSTDPYLVISNTSRHILVITYTTEFAKVFVNTLNRWFVAWRIHHLRHHTTYLLTDPVKSLFDIFLQTLLDSFLSRSVYLLRRNFSGTHPSPGPRGPWHSMFESTTPLQGPRILDPCLWPDGTLGVYGRVLELRVPYTTVTVHRLVLLRGMFWVISSLE